MNYSVDNLFIKDEKFIKNNLLKYLLTLLDIFTHYNVDN